MLGFLKKALLLALAWLVLGGWSVPAATGPSSAFNVKVWETEEGLPQSAVISLLQTRDGYLWAATLNGVARFDGIQFRTFDESNTPGLTSNRIVKLFEDSRGGLWLGTETAGVFLIEGGKTRYLDIGRGAPDGRVLSICEDRVGSVWLYTAGGQLCRYYSNKMDVWNAGADRPSNCRALLVDEAGLLWVGSDWSLTALGPITAGELVGLPVIYETSLMKLDYLLRSASGGYWRLANGRVQKWIGNRLELDVGPYPWTQNLPVVAACEDAEGNLIVGTYGEGVYWFDAQGRATHLRSELSHPYVLSLLFDREGCLWVGTNGRGLNRVKRTSFELLPGTADATVQTVAESPEGGLWIGYNGERIDRWLPGGSPGPSGGGVPGSLTHYTNFQSADFYVAGVTNSIFVRSILVDSEKRVWAGTYGNGVFLLGQEGFRRALGSGAVPREVSVLYQAPSGRIWAGTQRGLASFEDGKWHLATNGLGSHAIRALLEAPDKSLWVGTEGAGLHRLVNDKTTIRFSSTNGLPSDNITALALEGSGALWVGTSSGLARFYENKWSSYVGALARENAGIAYLLDDNSDWLWIGSNVGLARASKRSLKDFASASAETVQVRWYGTADGLPSRECTQGSQPAACRTQDGRLWFATTRGLVSLDPTRLRLNTNPPPVVIEAVAVDNRLQGTNTLRAEPPKSVVVPAGRQSLQIDFTSLGLSDPDKVRFRYRLEPHESSWLQTTFRFVRYSKVPPGEYQFQVTAANEDGFWNPVSATLWVKVLPPFWKTWQFMTATTLILLAVIVGSVHYVSTQRLQRQLALLRQQEALEKDRSRIARDLHDQLGANLTQVALLGELAEADKQQPAEVESHARQICQTARETTRALDEIVWTVNPSNDTIDGLVNYICKYAQEYLAIAGLRYRLEVPPDLPATPISPELRHNMFLVTKEALNNVVKHARAGSVWLRLRIEPQQFVVEIEDDGRGIGAGDYNKGRSGLRNMRKRMEDVGGQFVVSPGSNGGTLIGLSAPLHRI